MVCYWLLMLLAFHIPISEEVAEEADLPLNSDKTIHVVLYAGFGLLLSGTLETYGRRRARTMPTAAQAALLLAVVSVYGYLDEFTQPWTGRRYDLADFAADVVGAVVGIAIYQLLRALGLFRRLGIEA